MRIHQLALATVALPLVLWAQPSAANPPLKLSLRQAIAAALSPGGDARWEIAEAGVQQAEAHWTGARAALLPSVDVFAAEQGQARSLDAFGLGRVQIPVPGFNFPSAVGPFATFDARVSVSQNLFNPSSRKRVDASRAGVEAAKAETRVARNQISTQVAILYLAALRAAKQEEVIQANAKLAQALLQLAQHRHAAGEATALDISRASAQLSAERQRLLAAESERAIAWLELLKTLGASMEARLELTDTLESVPTPAYTVQEAVEIALKNRGELTAQEKRIEGARLNDRAAELEKLPLIAGYGDYGALGSTRMASTYTFGVSIRLPVFAGGRRESNRADALAEIRQQELRAAEMRRRVELEVRRAFEKIRLAGRQVEISEETVRLASDELTHARRRYDAGLTLGIEVVEAQTRLARSQDDRVAALYGRGQAIVELAAAMGTIDGLFQ